MVAKELPDRRVVLQARVTSMLPRPASITRAALTPPAGYEAQELPQELQFLYPLQVVLTVPVSIDCLKRLCLVLLCQRTCSHVHMEFFTVRAMMCKVLLASMMNI